MNWREFVSDVIGSTAWPISAIVIVTVLRGKIIEWMREQGPVKRARVGTTGVEVEFAERLTEIEKKVEDELPPGDLIAASSQPEIQREREGFLGEMDRLAAVDPRAAVLMSFIRLESTFRECLGEDLAKAQSRPAAQVGMRQMIDYAAERRLISLNEVGILKDLSGLRNAIAHGADTVVDEDLAQGFAEAAFNAATMLRFGLGHAIERGEDPL